MKKGLIILIVVGAVLLSTGAALFGLSIAKGAFSNNSYTQEVSKEHNVDDSFSKIDIDVTTADLTIKPAEDDKTKVVSIEREKIHHTVKVSNDTLVIREQDDRKFYEKWFGFIGRMKLTVYLPGSTYNELKVDLVTGDTLVEDHFNFDKQNLKSTTGNFTLSNVTGSSANIKATTGSINLTNYSLTGSLDADTTTGDFNFDNVNCNKATLHTTSGDFNLNDLIVSGEFDSDRPNLDVSGTSSDIHFKNCDARNIKMKTTTGEIKGNFLTPKNFDAESTTGHPLVDNDRNAADKCYAHTTTGDIDISVGAI